jgi:hypothetical protein
MDRSSIDQNQFAKELAEKDKFLNVGYESNQPNY